MPTQPAVSFVGFIPGILPAIDGLNPRITRLNANNYTLAQVMTAGFLTPDWLATNTMYESDFVATLASDAFQWLKPVFNNGVLTLTEFP